MYAPPAQGTATVATAGGTATVASGNWRENLPLWQVATGGGNLGKLSIEVGGNLVPLIRVSTKKGTETKFLLCPMK